MNKLIIFLVVFLTLATSGVTVAKVSAKFTETKLPDKGISIKTGNPQNSPTATPGSSQPAKTVASTSVQSLTNGSCIITLFGKQYDVTVLQNSHTGGNLFNCGTDMTSIYQSKHGTDVSRMAAYLMTGPSPTGVPTVSPTTTPTNSPSTVTPIPKKEETYLS